MPDFREESYLGRRIRLAQWLRKNVQTYPEPAAVTLTAFDVDWAKLGGRFEVLLDETLLPEKYSFAVEATGRPTIFHPMFHSPLGVPASFKAVELTAATDAAILRALESCIPRLRAYGLDRETGQETDGGTPLQRRVLDPDAFAKAMATMGPGFRVTVTLTCN